MEAFTKDYLGMFTKHIVNTDLTQLNLSSKCPVIFEGVALEGRLIYIEDGTEAIPALLYGGDNKVYVCFINQGQTAVICKRGSNNGWCDIRTSSRDNGYSITLSKFISTVLPKIKYLLNYTI